MADQLLLLNQRDLEEQFSKITEQVFLRAKKEIEAQQSEKYLSPKVVAELLDINVCTLWRWEKSGYLLPIRVGAKVRYRKSDIDKLLDGRD